MKKISLSAILSITVLISGHVAAQESSQTSWRKNKYKENRFPQGFGKKRQRSFSQQQNIDDREVIQKIVDPISQEYKKKIVAQSSTLIKYLESIIPILEDKKSALNKALSAEIKRTQATTSEERIQHLQASINFKSKHLDKMIADIKQQITELKEGNLPRFLEKQKGKWGKKGKQRKMGHFNPGKKGA